MSPFSHLRTQRLAFIFIHLFALGTIAGLSGCAKKREVTFQQGQGSDLELISAYQDKDFSLKTLGPRVQAQPLGKGNEKIVVDKDKKDEVKKNGTSSSQSNFTKSEKVSILKGAHPRVNMLDLVEIDTAAKLLSKDIPFRGLPNQKEGVYSVRYQITNSYLKVLKIAKPSDIPMQELSYAENLSDGRVAVPLVGYKLRGLFRVEAQRSEAGKDTNVMMEVAESDLSKATHFKVNLASREIFDAIRKVDVFPADLFGTDEANNNEWYMSVTVVNTQEGRITSSGDGESFVGSETAIEAASRIKMLRTASGIRGVNLNVDPRVAKSDVLNLDPILMIPAKWKDYRAVRAGTDKALKEEAHEDRNWSQRDYMEIDFEAMTQIDAGSSKLAKLLDAEKKLVDLEIAPNYIAYTLEETDKGVRTKFAFLRAGDRDYQPRVAFFKDMKQFGFFTQTRSFIENFETYRQEDYEKNQVLQRFNPKKDIVFHFTNNSPKDLRQIGKAAVEEWNRIFEKEAGIKVTLAEDDVALGDLRYNKINLIETVSDGGGLLGYGPSIADPRTGEIISSTANIYVNPVRSGIINSIRRYVLEKTDALQGKSIDLSQVDTTFAPVGASADGATKKDEDSDESTPESIRSASKKEELAFYGKLDKLKDPAKKLKLLKAYEKLHGPEVYARQSLEPVHQHGPACSVGMINNRIYHEIEMQCDRAGKLTQYIESVRSSGKFAVPGEIEILRECSSLMIADQMMPTLLHEMGHNFGLRHNFRGSYDAANFGDPNERRSSSVMEYSASEDRESSTVGPYDIAAIRFGYGEKVLLADDSVVSIDSNVSLEDNIKAKNLKLHAFEFCTDEDQRFAFDPFCKTFDSGTTPMEVVDFRIREFEETFKFGYSRLGRFLRWGNNWADHMGQVGTLIALKEIYDAWRGKISSALHAQKRSPYLAELSEEQFEAELKNLAAKDEAFAKHVAEYRPAAEKAVNFLKYIAFLPNSYCILDTGNVGKEGKPWLDAIEFNTIADQLATTAGVNMHSCKQPEAQSWAVANKMKMHSQIGFPLETGNFTRFQTYQDVQTFNGFFAMVPDFIGMKGDRILAMRFLTTRNRSSRANRQRDSFPNVLDEPKYRNEIQKVLMSRILDGVDLRGQKIEGLGLVPRFAKERDLVHLGAILFMSGLMQPDSDEATPALNQFASLALRQGTADFKEVQSTAIPIGNMGYIPKSKTATQMVALSKRFRELISMGVDMPATMQESVDNFAKVGKDPNTEFIALYSATFQAIQVFSAVEENEYEEVLKNEPRLALIENLGKKLDTILEGAKTQQEKQALAKTKISAISGADLVLPSDFVFDAKAVFPKFWENGVKTYNSYLNNKVDYDAQIELIRMVIKASYDIREGG